MKFEGNRHTFDWDVMAPLKTRDSPKWYSSSQVSTAKHVSYPQLTATYNNNYPIISCRLCSHESVISNECLKIDWMTLISSIVVSGESWLHVYYTPTLESLKRIMFQNYWCQPICIIILVTWPSLRVLSMEWSYWHSSTFSYMIRCTLYEGSKGVFTMHELFNHGM